MGICCTSSGDLGDIVALMSVLHGQPGAPHRLLLKDDGMTCGIERRAHIIIPLAESQPYISCCRIATPEDKIDWRSGEFRKGGYHRTTNTLVDAHAAHGLAVGAIKRKVRGHDPWLTIEGYPDLERRVVVSLTERWRNPHFPWKQITEIYGDAILFIGEPHEYALFCSAYGHVDYRRTKDLLEAAKVIAGSWMFIGNQSCCFAIAEGLKHRRILEVSIQQVDCIYPGGCVLHCIDGELTLPLLDGGEHFIPSPIPNVSYRISTQLVPPGGWRWKAITSNIFTRLQETVVRETGCSEEEAKRTIMDATFAAVPHFFPTGEREDVRRNLVDAYRNSM